MFNGKLFQISGEHQQFVQLGFESLELRLTLRCDLDLLLLPHEVVSRAASDAHAQVAIHQVARLSNELHPASDRSEQRSAVPFPHAHRVRIEWKRSALETMHGEPLEYSDLRRRQFEQSPLCSLHRLYGHSKKQWQTCPHYGYAEIRGATSVQLPCDRQGPSRLRHGGIRVRFGVFEGGQDGMQRGNQLLARDIAISELDAPAEGIGFPLKIGEERVGPRAARGPLHALAG